MPKTRTIAEQISRLAKEDRKNLSEEEIYTSSQMTDYLRGLTGTFLGNPKKALDIHIISAGEGGPTACTDGKTVTLNWQTELVSKYTTPQDRFIAFMGMFFHECAHVLYTDFNTDINASKVIESGMMFGKEPVTETQKEEETLLSLKTAMADPKYTALFTSIYSTLCNILDDRHDEDKIMQEYGSLCVAPIFKTREAIRCSFELFEKMEEKIANGEISKISAFMTALLEYSRFESIEMSDESTWETSEILQALGSSLKYIDNAVSFRDKTEQYSAINGIVLQIWAFILEQMKDSSSAQNDGNKQSGDPQNRNGSSGTSGSTGSPFSPPQNQNGQQGVGQSSPQQPDLSEEEIQNILDALKSAAEKVSPAAAPTNRRSTPASKGNNQSPTSVSPVTETTAARSAGVMEAAMDMICSEVSEEKAESEVEQMINREAVREILSQDRNDIHKRIDLIIDRDLNSMDKERWTAIHSVVASYSKRLQREILEALKDLKDCSLNKHRPYGKILRAQDSYRPDGLCFANRKLPEDLPDMAIAILVDNSGSMYGERIDAARRAAIMLYDFAGGLGIPVMVAGHTTSGESVVFSPFTLFDKAGERDRYRLATMEAHSCNRDGMCLDITAKMLENRPEPAKLLFIISDGRPNHTGYHGKEADDDIKSVVRKSRGKGIEVIAAAIGDDKENIKEIYGEESFLDITELEKLPKKMTGLVRKKILGMI